MISESAQEFLRASGLVTERHGEDLSSNKEVTARLIDHIFQSIRF
jgi:hypothetical protein